MQAYKEIEAKYVTENVFSQFCYKTLPNPSHLWLFKKQLCMQMALSGAMRTSLLGQQTGNALKDVRSTPSQRGATPYEPSPYGEPNLNS